MGPEPQAKSPAQLPSRPKFAWDLKTVPWTDGKGPQDEYAAMVTEWSNFHDLLPDSNPNKFTKNLRGAILKSQCYGRAKDLVKAVSIDKLNSDDGARHVVNAIHKCDPLSFVTDLYNDFNRLLSTRRNQNESVMNFESRFEAQLSRFKAHGAGCIPESLLALMLLAQADIEDNQRVSILAASVSTVTSSELEAEPTVNDMLSQVKYNSIASVLRQCDRSRQANRHDDGLTLHPKYATGGGGNSANRSARNLNGNNQSRRQRTPAELAFAKATQPCKLCLKKKIVRFGHWSPDHNPDGTLKPGAVSSETPLQVDSNGNYKNASKSQETKSENMLGFTSVLTDADTLQCKIAHSTSSDLECGPLVDDGAPYSALGQSELNSLKLKVPYDIKLEPLPGSLSQYRYWQFGNGTHSSPRREIIGSVALIVKTDNGNNITIRHLVVAGDSQWIIGRNLTRKCNLEYIGRCSIRLPTLSPTDYIAMYDHDRHSHVKLDRFVNYIDCPSELSKSMTPVCAIIKSYASNIDHRNWTDIRRVIDRVHKHVCGHASYSDMRTLLDRNKLWSYETQKYLTELVSNCEHCKASSTPPPNRRVSLSSLCREFNDIVCLDHFFLDSVTIIHCMDASTRFSAGAVVTSTDMESAIYNIELLWFAQFWPPNAFQADMAFQNDIFKSFLNQYDVELRPVPPRRHAKNPIEPRHGTIRSIFLRLKSADSNLSDSVLAIRAIRISNDLYGSDTMSAFELAKGFSKPLATNQSPIPIDHALLAAHDELIAKRKLTLIMRSNCYPADAFKVGDMVQIFIHDGKNKRGSWTSPRTVLSIDTKAGSITVPGRAGKIICAAVEDARAARSENDLALSIQQSIDELDFNLVDTLSPQPSIEHESEISDETSTEPPGDFTGASSRPDSSWSLPEKGDRIAVFWPLENQYYSGTVNSVESNGSTVVHYDDNDIETLDLSKEEWRYDQPESLHASTSGFSTTLESNEQAALSEMLDSLGNRPFLRHHAQAFDPAPMVNSYSYEEQKFLKNVKVVPRSSVPRDANIIGSHTVYRLKFNDDKSLALKARIAPHGNEDSEKGNLETACCMCPPVGIRIISTTATVRKWRVVRIDNKSAFLQTGEAGRNVFVHPPVESPHRHRFLWLLLVAAYGLVNANAKWQHMSDNAFKLLGLVHVDLIPQLFFKTEKADVVLLAIKIVDDILLTGTDPHLRQFITAYDARFKLGEVVHGPGQLRFYGMNLIQNEDLSVSIHADDKLKSLEPYPISRTRRRQVDNNMNAIERKAFMSVNASIGWLGITSSPLCSFYSSHLQQKIRDSHVSALLCQFNALKVLKKHGTLSHYPVPVNLNDITLVAFADASHTKDSSQLCYLIGLVYGTVQKGSPFHLITWSSHRSYRPAKSTPAAEILAASESVDEIVMLKRAFKTIFSNTVQTMVIVDSKDLYKSLSSKRNTIDKSVRPDINAMRFYFETEIDVFAWIPGSLNPADVGTKINSPLTDVLALTLATGVMEIDLTQCEQSRRDKSFG